MGRAPCCDKEGVKKGPWTPEEDQKLVDNIKQNGHGSWRTLPKRAGLLRCGKSCRLRWINYLRPDIKRGKFSVEEEQIIIQLHSIMGNKWSAIAARLPGRTDNEIKNFWNSQLRKRLLHMGIDPVTHRPRTDLFAFSNMNPFMTAERENARLLEAMMTREYYLRMGSANMVQQQQEARRHNQNTGLINEVATLMRSQLESSLSRPDFTTDSILPQISAQNSQLESLEYNRLVTQALQQLQSQSQLMNNLQHLPSTSTLDSLRTQLQHQDNNPELSHCASMINSQTSVTLDQDSIPDSAYDNFLNGWRFMSQQQTPSQSHDINTSMGLDSSTIWTENQPFGFFKCDEQSDLPALRSSTPSPGIFSDPDLVAETSSSMASMNANTSSSFTATCDESYGIPVEFLMNSQEASQQKEKIPMENVEDERVYWRNVLGSLDESP